MLEFFVCRILIYYDGVEMSFDMSGNLPHFRGNKKGRVYLTTHRVCHWLYTLLAYDYDCESLISIKCHLFIMQHTQTTLN